MRGQSKKMPTLSPYSMCIGDTKDMDEPRTVRRQRIAADVRIKIVDEIMAGMLNGAEAAKKYAVSEATVHRLIKAEEVANPARIRVIKEDFVTKGHLPSEAENVVQKANLPSRRALTQTQAEEIVERICSGSMIATDLARELGVHKSTISRIVRAAKAQNPARPIPVLDAEEWQRRLDKGVARAMSDGRHPGSKIRLNPELQETILQQYEKPGETFASVARKCGVNATTVSRLIYDRRVRPVPADPQSLEAIFSDLLK